MSTRRNGCLRAGVVIVFRCLLPVSRLDNSSGFLPAMNQLLPFPPKSSSLYKTSSSNLPEFGLYEVQEQMIVSRGELEEKLMVNNYTPLQANKPKIRGAGAGGGFGGGSKGGGKKSVLKAQGKSHANVLRKEGVVRIDDVISKDLAAELREFELKLREKAIQDVKDGDVPKRYRFADVLLKQNRCDLVQPLGDDLVMRALDQMLNHSAIRTTIEALLGSDAVLYEFSCLISDPGSQRQVVHPDTPYGAMGGLAADEPVLYTCFLSLQDISEDMGPTVWLPHTHTQKTHDAFKDESIDADDDESPKDHLLRTAPAVLGMLPAGCCGIFDSRLLHAGGANVSKNAMSRALLYVSFKNPKIGYPGNPASIRPDIGDAKLTMQQLGKELDAYMMGKPARDLDALIVAQK